METRAIILKGLRLILTSLVIGVGGVRSVSAHAFLDHAEPRVGSTVEAAPPAVTLEFTEAVEPDFSRIEVRDAHDQPVAVGALEHPHPEELQVSLPPLPSGDYTVHWVVTSVDTHQTEGRFEFTVSGP